MIKDKLNELRMTRKILVYNKNCSSINNKKDIILLRQILGGDDDEYVFNNHPKIKTIRLRKNILTK